MPTSDRPERDLVADHLRARRARRPAARTCCWRPSPPATVPYTASEAMREEVEQPEVGVRHRPCPRCVPEHAAPSGPAGTMANSANTGAKASIGAEVEQELVGAPSGTKSSLVSIFRTSVDDVRAGPPADAFFRPGQVDARAVGADAVLHQRAPLALGQREQRGDDHHEHEHQEEDVRSGRLAPVNQVLLREAAHERRRRATTRRRAAPKMKPMAKRTVEDALHLDSLARGACRTRGSPAGRPSAPVGSGLMPGFSRSGGERLRPS